MSWKTACEALRLETGGYLHIHGNVDITKTEENSKEKKSAKEEWHKWAVYAQKEIKKLLEEREKSLEWNVSIEHIEYVKSYGPRVDHLVLDLLCRPSKNKAES
jgi:tRNA G37 N-methylase Trm5